MAYPSKHRCNVSPGIYFIAPKYSLDIRYELRLHGVASAIKAAWCSLDPEENIYDYNKRLIDFCYNLYKTVLKIKLDAPDFLEIIKSNLY